MLDHVEYLRIKVSHPYSCHDGTWGSSFAPPPLSSATTGMSYAIRSIRSIKPFMSGDVLRSTYFSYAHSIISYGIILWGNSSYSEDIFKIQKRIMRIIMNSSKNASCWQLFKDLNILPIQ
jgi:hypothetical protein